MGHSFLVSATVPTCGSSRSVSSWYPLVLLSPEMGSELAWDSSGSVAGRGCSKRGTGTHGCWRGGEQPLQGPLWTCKEGHPRLDAWSLPQVQPPHRPPWLLTSQSRYSGRERSSAVSLASHLHGAKAWPGSRASLPAKALSLRPWPQLLGTALLLASPTPQEAADTCSWATDLDPGLLSPATCCFTW